MSPTPMDLRNDDTEDRETPARPYCYYYSEKSPLDAESKRCLMVYRDRKDAEEARLYVATFLDGDTSNRLTIEKVCFSYVLQKCRATSMDVRLVTRDVDPSGVPRAYLFSAYSTSCDEVREALRETFYFE